MRIEKIKEGRYIVEGKINIFVRVSVSKPSSFIAISSSVDRKAVDCKASPTGSVLDNSLGLSEQDISLYKEVLIGVHPYLDLVGKGLLQSPWGLLPWRGSYIT